MALRALSLEIAAQDAEALSEALLDAGAASVAHDNVQAPRTTLEVLLADSHDPAEVLGAACARAKLQTPLFSVRAVVEEDWVRRSQSQFAPVEIGERLWVGATWHVPPSQRAVVRIDPGLAFGTGSHPTTRLMLEFLARHVHGGEAVLDYGCGSGILAIAAAKLGAARVDAVDIDPQAVETATANALANGLVLRPTLPEGRHPGPYDIVVANILAQPLIELAPLLAARVAPGGRLALAGILGAQAPEVAAAYAPWLQLRTEALLEGWALVAGGRA